MNIQSFTFENRFFEAYTIDYVFVYENRVRLNEPDGNVQTFYFADNAEAQEKADGLAQYFDNSSSMQSSNENDSTSDSDVNVNSSSYETEQSNSDENTEELKNSKKVKSLKDLSKLKSDEK